MPLVDHQRQSKHGGSDRPSSAGDGPGFESLDEFLGSVERKAYHIGLYALRDEQSALDVVQDTMLRLVERYATRPPGEWPALFFTILHNRITDMRRWQKLRIAGGKLLSLFRASDDNSGEQNLLDSGVGVDLMPEFHEPEQQTFSVQLRSRINVAIDRLSERQRQVFLLREWQGFNVRDTAAILGCSEGSVKQHHFRAMRSLRAELAEVWDHD